MELFRFANFIRLDNSLDYLSSKLALPESWSYSNPEKEYVEGNCAARFTLPILRNYLEHTYRRVRAEQKIHYTIDRRYSCFNTGLVTSNLEEIFAFFEQNKSLTPKSPYFFKAFIKKSDSDFLTYFSQNQPLPANYFGQPEFLLFNPMLELIPDIDHIIDDNKHRFPEPLKTAPSREVRKLLIGAIDDISKRARINYKLAIPQYYDGKIQLLLPLYLVSNHHPDLALVIDRINTTTYSARTCLTLGMAYNNARLIVCPHSEWLQP